MSPTVALAVFPVIFLAELPDKTMLASLVLSTRGKPVSVWAGTAAAFLVHVVIATTIGVGLFNLLPHRAVEALVAALFLGGAVYAWVEAGRDESPQTAHESVTHQRVVTVAFMVTFVAEWGDLSQLLTANLAARYHDGLAVGIGSTAALWAVSGLAIVGGQGILRFVNVRTVRRITALVLLVLGVTAAIAAFR